MTSVAAEFKHNQLKAYESALAQLPVILKRADLITKLSKAWTEPNRYRPGRKLGYSYYSKASPSTYFLNLKLGPKDTVDKDVLFFLEDMGLSTDQEPTIDSTSVNFKYDDLILWVCFWYGDAENCKVTEVPVGKPQTYQPTKYEIQCD